MRIGFIGWYGHNNAGDERMLYCLRRFFNGHELVVTSGLDNAMARIEELNSCQFVLLGGGGLILRRTGKYSRLIDGIKPRFGCVGISIEAVHPDNIDFIEAIKEKAEFILVRDYRSREQLGYHFKSIVGPDLTFLYPLEPVPAVISDSCGLNLRPWRYWGGEHNGYFDRLMHLLNSKVKGLEHLYPFSKYDKDIIFDVIEQSFEGLIPLPLYSEKGAENDCDILSRYFGKVPLDFAVQDLQSCRYLIAMRLHALIFACQMGIPFLSLSYQPKNEQFCNSLDMPELSIDIHRPELLLSAIENLRSQHAQIRSMLIDICATNQNEITNVMSAIRRLIL